ncbi:Putative major facilitator superfamily, MFS transporter superfamily [Septoria linicola]|uniref:Major facilitator superfamily, MFS transporter superfamily n=1 Tax=Septoria linicola TaxID=215465 RepID=A0A9Q9ATP1_9PEZI|nr:putative major facilitator superfamily, MFS transporter superfamily [Septoria linicola]USW54950.1 Putative major facilitator superfamily, MFS transporter superfamily [Septoria linicola]
MAGSDRDAKSRSDIEEKHHIHGTSLDDAQGEAKQETSETDDAQTPPFSPVREVAFVFTICMAQFLALAGLAQSIAPLPMFGQSFGITDEGTFILPAGRLGDMYGHRNVAIVGYVWYAIWSIVAGVAVYSGDILFTVARGMQGIGPALVVPNSLALVGIAYGASPRKNMVFALFGAAAPTGWVVGAAFSSILAQLAWWPWAFFALTLACVAMIALNLVAVPADPRKGAVSFKEFDSLGCLTGVSGLILFNFAWNQAAVVSWQEPYTYALLIVGILLLPIFVWVELRIAQYPLVPLKGMAGEAALALRVIAAGWASFGIWVFYLWRLIENLRGYSPLAATAQNAPVAISGLIAAVATGFLLSHIKTPYVLLITTLFFLTGQILIATVPVNQIYWAQTFVSIILMPWGMDMSFPSATVLLSNSTPNHDQEIASSLVNTTVNYSISLGLGIAGTIVRQLNATGGDVISGYRGAWYFGIGLDGLAVVIALYFVVKY